MLSYHNDPSVKEKYVARFAEHRRLDEVVQGVGFESCGNGWRGCFVGCCLDEYNHVRFEVELGWPVWLARLADSIFEGLSKDEAPQFGTDLLAAVSVGVDLEPIRHAVAVHRMNALLLLPTVAVGDESWRVQVRNVIIQVRDLHAARSAWSRSAAESEAESAWQAERACLLSEIRKLS